MSQDATLQVVERYRDHLNLRVFENPKVRSTFAFYKGIDEAKGDLFMVVSGHSILKEDFVEEDVNTFVRVQKEEPKLAGVGGICENVYENTFGKIIGLMYYSSLSGARSCRYSRKPHFSDSVIFGVFDKKIVVSNGKFDEDFIVGQDDELPLRLRLKGYKFYTNPNIIAYYFTRNSFKGFFKQTFNYGVAKGLLVRKGYHRIEWFKPASFWFIPVSFLSYEIFLSFLFTISGFSYTLAFVPMFLYWLMTLSVSLHLLVKTKNFLCLFLPFMYFILHNVLGVSSLMGLFFGKKTFK
jgi:GT2 family glycosyltransferase